MKLISGYEYDKYIGGAKAKTDIEKIVENNFSIKIENIVEYKEKKDKILSKVSLKIRKVICILKNFFYKDDIILQVPFANNKLMRLIKNKIAFIHDIHGLQFNKNEILEQEIKFYRSCKLIIVHNEKMKKYLEERKIDSNKIIVLELFDYLCKKEKRKRQNNDDCQYIIYSGSLDQKKIPFLYQIEEEKINFKINLYGTGIDKDINEKILYKGSYSPLELPNEIQGDLGLVWDGQIDERDENDGFKMYTKYNNPHKLSCYIAAEIPVIVWEKAAIADLVKKYNIGYTIHNIYDINNIDFSDLDIKKKNVADLSKKVRTGYFTKKVINQIIER